MGGRGKYLWNLTFVQPLKLRISWKLQASGDSSRNCNGDLKAEGEELQASGDEQWRSDGRGEGVAGWGGRRERKGGWEEGGGVERVAGEGK
jgi:hypothetical protein